MKILGLDSSGLVASVAVVEDDGVNSNLLAEYTVNYKKTHSRHEVIPCRKWVFLYQIGHRKRADQKKLLLCSALLCSALLCSALLCCQCTGAAQPCQAIFHAAPPLSDGIG